MKVIDIDLKDRSENLVKKLLVIWESSVKETHLFLSDNEINDIKKYVPQALKKIPRLILLKMIKIRQLVLWVLSIII